MPVVVDASLAVAGCFEDEVTPYTDAVLVHLRNESAIVPAIWPLEVGNALILGERRDRIGRAEMDEALHRLQSLPIVIAVEPLDHVWTSVLDLARAQRRTAYDASYLDLALRRGAPLATLDARLRDATLKVVVPLFDPDGPGSR